MSKFKPKEQEIGRCHENKDGSRYPSSAEIDKVLELLASEVNVSTPEEAKALSEARTEEAIRSMITPEILTHFSKREALIFLRQLYLCSGSTTQGYNGLGGYGLAKLSDDDEAYLSSHIKGRRVIEIGDAGENINRGSFLNFGAKSFETTDSKYGRGLDGLSYLARQSEGSAIVCSFGVFDEGVLHMGNDELGKILNRYRVELANEIYRVTPRDTITFHGLEWYSELKDAGFSEDKCAPRCLNTWDVTSGGLKTLIKK
jgi:hypothetical protein